MNIATHNVVLDRWRATQIASFVFLHILQHTSIVKRFDCIELCFYSVKLFFVRFQNLLLTQLKNIVLLSVIWVEKFSVVLLLWLSQVWQTEHSCCCCRRWHHIVQPQQQQHYINPLFWGLLCNWMCTECHCVEWKHHTKPWKWNPEKSVQITWVNSSLNGPWPRLPSPASKDAIPELSFITCLL